ncbi:ABC transporter ATP-binding protein [Bacilliculturomica massiliensis]|uniref:ABC transporter ATP-binding protein n=1 Tax=Bacilliculturomica massiliensis TaxID=1917867 RepID=UPI00102F817B|nr:ABC transporter ATP-binding protein [Bacilliculturomica massiliensis]
MISLIQYIVPYFGYVLGAVVLLFGQAACDLALPDFMSDIVNEGITTGNASYILQAGAQMLGVSLLSAACSVAVGLLASRAAAGVSRDLRIDIFEKVESFSNAEFDRFSTSSLITRTTNDITQIQMLIVMMIRMVFYAPIMGVGGFFHALAKSTSMSWIIGIAVTILIGLVMIMFTAAVPKFKIVQNLIDRLNLVVRENLDGMLVVRAFNTQRFEEDRFDQVNGTLTATNLFVNRITAGMMPAMMLLMNLVTVLVVWVGAHQVSSFQMEVGDMMAYMQYVMQIIMAFLMMSMMFIMIPRASVSANRVAEVLAAEASVEDEEDLLLPEEEKKDGARRGGGEVVFDHVSFHYPDADEDVLHDISFTAKPGQTTAFIGSTGSGKSALVNLIPRFYDVTGGEIRIDGVPLKRLRLHDLRNRLGYVPQKGVLFSGTIRSNLAYADPEASEEQIVSAAAIAQAMEFIESKPERFDTPVAQGGGNVSGGQKQRLSIARALVKRPQIYIFDDSFSALDFKTDSALRAALKEQTGDSTVLLVAQRISTIMGAEQIIVLDHGRIKGIGTHRELLDSCDIYREIALSQLSEEELQ